MYLQTRSDNWLDWLNSRERRWNALLPMRRGWLLGSRLSGKRGRGQGISASLLPNEDLNTTLLVANIYVNRTQCLALVDTGCSRTIVDADRCRSWRRAAVDVITIGGMSRSCCGVGTVTVATDGGNSAKISVLVVRDKLLGYDLLSGIDAIKALGGVVVWPSGQIRIGSGLVQCAAITRLHCYIRPAEPSLDCGMEVVWRPRPWRTGQWSIGLSSGSGDPRGLRAGASLVDMQWPARAVPGRKAGASQRANSLDSRVTAKQIQSTTSYGFPRAQPPRWRIHCRRRRLRNQAARMATEGLQYVSARPQESVPSGMRSRITVAISDRENWREEILSDTLGIWFERRSSHYEGHHQHGADSGCDRESSGVCVHIRYLHQWGCRTRDPRQRTSGSVWTRMQVPGKVGKQYMRAGTGSREGTRQTAMEARKRGSRRPPRHHTTDSILFVWKACQAPSGVWLAPRGLRDT